MTLRTVVFELDEATPTLNAIRGMNVFAYRDMRQAMAWKVRAALSKQHYFAQAPMQRCRIVIARYSVGEPDPDGVVGGVKPLCDALVVASPSHPNGLGVIADDNPRCMELTVQAIRVATHAEQKTVVAIQELDALPVAPVVRAKRPRRFSGAARKGASIQRELKVLRRNEWLV